MKWFLFLPFYLMADSVIVSVAPHQYFVERIAGNTLEVVLLVPASATPHSYEPPPKQILAASQAAIWFRIGEGFEKKAIETLLSHKPTLAIVDLRRGLPLIPSPHCAHSGQCCSAEGADLHIWVSVKLAQLQAQTIADTLIQHYPEHAPLYRTRLEQFLSELRELDQQFTRWLEPVKGKVVLVSHPAYSYFCRDYGLEQLSLEQEGREPTPKTMTALIEKAKRLRIKTLFTQAQYPTKGAELVANLLGAQVVSLDPYAEDYLHSMTKIAKAFQTGLL